jgi:hypothetical protein
MEGHSERTTQPIYANWVRSTATPFEMALEFGYSPEGGPPADVPVLVAMTWEHAKALADLLNSNLAAFEAQAGPIRNVFEPANQGGDDGHDE